MYYTPCYIIICYFDTTAELVFVGTIRVFNNITLLCTTQQPVGRVCCSGEESEQFFSPPVVQTAVVVELRNSTRLSPNLYLLTDLCAE